MEIKGLNESLIRRYSDIATYKKGERYLKKGNILSMEQHGRTLCAMIKTDGRITCETTIMFDSGGIVDVACTCEGANWCEHVVSTLLGVIQQPEMIKFHLDLKDLVQKKTLEELKNMILKIAENNTDMEHLFVKYLSEIDHESAIGTIETGIDSNSPLVDPGPFAKKVGYIIKKYENRSNTDDAISEISDLVDEALDFVSNGDGANALIIMESIINGYVKQWMELDGSMGDTALFFEDLDMALSKSILMGEKTREENRKYLKKIDQWQQQLDGYGVENAFALSIASLVQGWDDPVLQRILDGEKVSMSVWGKNVPEYASLLTAVRLEILDIEKKYQEYLNLALHEKAFFDYIMMLIKLNRPEEVLKQAGTMLTYNYQALTVAEELRRSGYLNEAMEIASKGLTLEGPSLSKLAFWLSERYEALEDNQKALESLLIAFKEEPSLNDFLRIRDLAPSNTWPDIRNRLLTELGKAALSKTTLFNLSDIIDIFLHEGLVNKAIKIVDKESYNYKEVIRVLDAAIKEKPEWVIKNACARAEEILEQANSKHYNKAVTFLKKAQTAYNETKMVDLWNDYKDSLLKRHSRKSKFMALTDKLK
ncbi:MAG: SWIM zinc finger domain-containing protein [Desulfamplus sp.]|nr:SWIM zinc finger domain-containing protein [Desulfamplus sp.]MBF0258769.1 SWIM zinc finger domain-containing protein [Desulfamplus sp.]